MTTQVPASFVITGLPKLRPRLQSDVRPTAPGIDAGTTMRFCLNSQSGVGATPGSVTSSA
jgi:hypothetical protein